jgi:hypothetical protein
MLDVVLVVGGDTLETANRYRLRMLAIALLHATTAASRLAGTVAGTPQNARKYIGNPVHHIGIAVTALADQTDVFWNRCVGRTGPLTIDNFVKIVRIGGIGGLQVCLLSRDGGWVNGECTPVILPNGRRRLRQSGPLQQTLT